MKNLKPSTSVSYRPQPVQPVWCHRCCIRIAPYDAKTVVRGKNYHRGCYAKTGGVNGKPGKT
jgi:hypothetical protein